MVRVGGFFLVSLFFLSGFLFPVDLHAADDTDTVFIDKIEIEGISRADISTVRYYISAKEGKRLELSKIRDDVLNLYKVGVFDRIYVDLRETLGKKVLVYIFKEKPFIRDLIIEGRKKVSEKDLLENIKSAKGTFFKQDLISWDISRMEARYHSKGYYAAKVSSKVKYLEDNEVILTYVITEDEKIIVHDIKFEGIKSFSSDEIRLGMLTKESDWRSSYGDRGAFSKDFLNADLLSVESFYHDRGHVRVKLFNPEVEIDKEHRNIYIKIPLKENERYYVGDIVIEGDDIYDEKKLRSWLKLKKGDVFNRGLFREYMFLVIGKYSEKGYAYADVDTDMDIDDENKIVNIKLSPLKGRKVYIGKINITGNSRTRDRVIRRQLDIAEGEVYNSKKLENAKAKIRRLGFFEAVEFDQKARSGGDLIDINIDVVERDIGHVGVSFAYNSVEKFIIGAEIQWDNLLGRGQQLQLNANWSDYEASFRLGFTDPGLFDRDITGGFDIYHEIYTPYYRGYESTSDGLILRTGLSITDYIFVGIGNKFELNKIKIADKSKTSLYFSKQKKDYFIHSIFPYIVYDSRDDRYNPRKGSKLKLYGEYSGLLGNTDFYKVTLEFGNYLNLYENFVLFTYGKIGIVSSLDDSILPVTERFFMGGSSSLRGYSYQDIGPKDAGGATIGGEGSLNFTVELQYVFSNSFRGFIFYDRGNLYTTKAGFIVGDTDFYNILNMRSSIGLGCHFFSPFGPMSVSYGFKVDKKKGETPGEFSFSIGGSF